MLAIYRWFVEAPAARTAFGTALRRIAAASCPLLYHCSAGKDRTGWLTAVLLGALGADRATIVDDYVLTNEVAGPAMAHTMELLNARRGVPRELLWPVLAAEPAYLDEAFGAGEDRYGGPDGYPRGRAGRGYDERAPRPPRLL